MGTGEVVTRVEVARTEVALEVEVFGVEESVVGLVAERSVEAALVADGNEEVALVVEVDQTEKVVVVGGVDDFNGGESGEVLELDGGD